MSQTSGVLQFLPRGGGFLRDHKRSFQPGPDDVWVSSKLIRQYGLVEGVVVSGESQRSEKGIQLVDIASVCGLPPEQFRARTRFDRLLAVDPEERFRLGDSGKHAMRVVDLIAPIGNGTRGLIVASPKTGKTRLMEDIANAIRASEPETRIVVLLIDERPEEVTHFRRHVDAEVLASSSDQSVQSHVKLAELTLAHVRCELECGRDVVVLVDSLTRMARAFNKRDVGRGRTLTGGLDATALEIPRRFFGLARNIEGGGSVTVIATALIDTGSRMDDYIFQEFKGTGNSEIVLDRALAESRIFPAINIQASGTRKEELLYTEEEMSWLAALRRQLADLDPKAAITKLLNLIDRAPTNEALMRDGSKL
ncbi:transcription termination factor Rho [candidate division KSB1 bacterium]|nr:transcription termination factor Rho [candidate division KSB1 bacterium]NIR70967.1 transcription termination factor Rho [candidate division KSB1 bacterium]NIS24703.1 transcription termination factor Rho [candidate division KSB1 bacterium]NIT71612.1 transcription termination factor Rho [candidate division KSB1 bacterium]NIU25316.1 transcription termination factor Rho [candidate division KSB1 bacterium]